jgi:polar amino acid transport system substrate-binding protein
MTIRGRLSALGIVAVIAAACGGGATPTPAPTQASSAPTGAPDPTGTPIPGGLLDKVLTAGKIVMSTDPQYPPQSELTPSGIYQGFDIDVGTEIATRLGVDIAFETPSWDTITAGSWSGRWDFSVGSMTITTQRQAVIAFSDPYYFTPAQLATSVASGITTVAGLEGKVVCVGAATTYLDWFNGVLDFGTETPDTKPPTGSTATTLDTDRLCAEAWQAGRSEFDGWLSSLTTVNAAISAGLPVVKVGSPVFFEPLAVAFDKAGPDPTDMVAAIDAILADMRRDGYLANFSWKWFGTDLTKKPAG